MRTVTSVAGGAVIAKGGKILIKSLGPAAETALAKAAKKFVRTGCSFSGDTLVVTDEGLTPIKSISANGIKVWSRNADTGQMGWKVVQAQVSEWHDETVNVTVRDFETGTEQTIAPTLTHPFFVQLPQSRGVLQNAVMGGALPPSSEGHTYRGPLRDGYWVDAADLTAGYRLLNADATWAEVVSVEVVEEALNAYNLTVADFHTYFVAANEGAAPIWVHNGPCDKLFTSRSAAFRGAKESMGIPRSSQYTKVFREKLRDGNGNFVRTADGKIVETRNYVYNHPQYGQVVIKEHSLGHPSFSGTPAANPHFNIEKFLGFDSNGNAITSSIPGVSGHYQF